MAQNYEKLRNTCSIISKGYSFKRVGGVISPRSTSEKLKNFKWNPHIVVYHLKGHKRKFLAQIGGRYIDPFGVI